LQAGTLHVADDADRLDCGRERSGISAREEQMRPIVAEDGDMTIDRARPAF
jgi:hypothetical protein